MNEILKLSKKYNLYIIEDNAQSLGSTYNFNDKKVKYTGTIGHIGTTSFFPSKNLGCYGDGGAIFTNNDTLAKKIKMICNHGQNKKYYHEITGCNSRLDSIQASILNVKLKYYEDYIKKRIKWHRFMIIHLVKMKILLHHLNLKTQSMFIINIQLKFYQV